MKRVLFLCTANSCRSQMAEGWLRHLGGGRIESASAGTRASFVHPLAIRVMREAGVDIRGHRSKNIEEFRGGQFDAVITVCDTAKENCPFFPAPRVISWSFDDPAKATGAEEQRLAEFRRVRDEIRAAVGKFLADEG